MSSIQIPFSIRVSSGVKCVHVVGSWDNYSNQLPLARDKASTSGKTWCATIRFGSSSVVPGERYWYYYIVDGYHCAANPSVDHTVEPTTRRELNILDVPAEKKQRKEEEKKSSSSSSHGSSRSKHASSSSSSKHASSSSSSKHSSSSRKPSSSKHSSSTDRDFRKSYHNLAIDIPKGRPLSISEIKSPKPITPIAPGHILRYAEHEIDALAAQFGGTVMIDDDGGVTAIPMSTPSPASSISSGSSFYRSDSSSPSSTSSCSSRSNSASSSESGYSTPSSDYGVCTCDNYGITRRGDRIKMDCGGRVCGYSDDDASSSDCSSGSDAASPIRRRGVVFH